MKKRILSSLLMGALFVASMSTFTSCKDYDDDINNLQAQIDKAALASDVTALQSTVNSAATTASSALTKAEAAATQAGANETAIAAVKAVADQNAKDVATAITNAAKAQTTAEAAAAAAKTAQDSANSAIAAAAKAQASAASALEKIGNIEKNYVTSTTLDSKLASLKAEILADTTSNATLTKLSGQVTSFKGSINYLYSAVTSVELLGSYNGSGETWLSNDVMNDAVGCEMLHGIISETSKFGDNEAYTTSDPIISFTKGDDITNDAGFIVRVNPTNVDLTASATKIVLINSKGEVLSQVEAGTPEKYNELITRSTTVSAGLWKINFHVAAGVSEADFNKAIKSNNNAILYAVAINNTAADTTSTVAADRYVASTWDIVPSYTKFGPSRTFEYKVNNTEVAEIHNRWTTTGTTAFEDGTDETSAVNELMWADSTKDIPTPATAAVTSGTKTNVQNAGIAVGDDARYDKAPLSVEVNKEFTITIDGKDAPDIDYYYVVLDKDRALESAPSEWNAWSSYTYEGLGVTTSSSEKLSLKITSDKANGDIIGFRVYAVNRDGTLADPDGRAFYVQVGEAANSVTVKANVLAEVSNNGVATATTFPYETGTTLYKNTTIVALPKSLAASNQTATSGILDLDDASKKLVDGANVYYQLLDEKKAVTDDWTKAKYIAVSIDKPGQVLDGSTLSGTITATNKTAAGTIVNVNSINLSVTKVLPTTAPKDFSWKTNQLTDGTYICYVDPSDVSGTLSAWNVDASYGTKDFTQAVNGLSTDVNYAWTIASIDAKNNKFTEARTIANTGNKSIVTVDKSLVDNKTTHATTLNYTYAGVSCTSLTSKENQAVNIPVWTGNVIFACALDPSVQTYDWVATTVKVGETSTDYTDYAINYNTAAITCNSGKTSVDDLSKLITGTNAYYKTTKTGNGTTLTSVFAAANYIAGKFSATLTSDANSTADYFDVTFDGSTFTFKQKSGATTPTANVASHLNVNAKDAFGHEKTIFSLPLIVRAQ